jgi:hypothetical protein
MQQLVVKADQKNTAQHTVKAPPSAHAPARRLLELQHNPSNHGILRCCPDIIQAKLTMGTSGDRYEHEADRVAEAVMRTAEPAVQRTAGGRKEERLVPTKTVAGMTSAVAPLLKARIDAMRGQGAPLSGAVRAFFEPHLGHDLSHVRIHNDTSAAESAHALGAQAFTVGQDVMFATGKYAPETMTGKHLLAHELVHVLQQRAGSHSAKHDQKAAAEEIVQCKGDVPMGQVVGIGNAVPIVGEPQNHVNYVQNAIKGVGIFGWGGAFRLDRKVVNGTGVDSIYLPRSEFHLSNDPLKGASGALNLVYKTRAFADAALTAFGVSGMYTYYLGPGGHIYPTIISDTTAPALCAALRAAVELERTDAKAAEKLSIDLALWYIGARFPLKTGQPPRATTAPKAAASAAAATAPRGTGALVYVEIGAGDLKASIELARKGGVKVLAVDPVAPAASAVKELESLGGTFIKGTAESLSPGAADHVFQYFPWRIGGTGGRLATGGTWRLISDAIKLLKPNGAAHFVTEDLATAEFLAKEASSKGLRAVITQTTAGAAAAGASGAGVPRFSAALKVWLVSIYK